MAKVLTRFAPSPTGPLHLGHACAALVAWEEARRAGGRFLLRFEDIDPERCRPEWEAAIRDDLHWLGLDWPEPVWRQSGRLPAYREALAALWRRGLVYPCRCSRRDIAEALAAPQEGAPAVGPDGPVYPGTCRPPAGAPPPAGPLPQDVSLRLDMGRALASLDARTIAFAETGPCAAALRTRISAAEMLAGIGDVVLARRAFGTSYHLSVTLDDAAQGITLVTRGTDLAEASFIHRVLQRLLDLPEPTYFHHPLVRDAAGKRLAKRDDARALARYRAEGLRPDEIRALVGFDGATGPARDVRIAS